MHVHSKAFLLIFCAGILCAEDDGSPVDSGSGAAAEVAEAAESDYRVMDVITGEPRTSAVVDERGAFAFEASIMGGDGCGIIEPPDQRGPTREFYLLGEECTVVVGCTKIRPDYPQDDSLLREKVMPRHEAYNVIGGDFYSSKVARENGRKTFIEHNTAVQFNGLDDLRFVIRSNGFMDEETGRIRVDRHFIKDGFYIQVVGISPAPEVDADSNAEDKCRAVATAICTDAEDDGGAEATDGDDAE